MTKNRKQLKISELKQAVFMTGFSVLLSFNKTEKALFDRRTMSDQVKIIE